MSQSTSSSPALTDILNSQATLNRLNNDKEFVGLLYKTFLEELDERMQQFNAAVAEDDLDQALKRAHSLKGAAATIDAERVRNASFAMEMAARENQLDSIPDLFEALKAELSLLARELRRWLTANIA